MEPYLAQLRNSNSRIVSRDASAAGPQVADDSGATPGQLRAEHAVRLLLVGGGPVREGILERAAQMGMRDALLAPGFVPFEEIPTLLALADIAVALFPDTPYGRSKSPLKIYEAMAMQLPLVATAVGQPAEVLSGCAELIPPSDTRALTQALERLLDEPTEAARLGKEARRRAVEKHDWKRLGAQVLQLYCDIAE